MKKVFVLLCVLGFVLIIGTAGAADSELISTSSLVLRTIISTSMISLSFLEIKACNRRKEVLKRRQQNSQMIINWFYYTYLL